VRGLTKIYVATNWLAHWVMPLKKQVHPGWEYSGFNDPTREIIEKIKSSKLVKLLEKMFQNTSGWSIVEQVRAYHPGMERDSVRLLYFNA
jgi:hypothetical protein